MSRGDEMRRRLFELSCEQKLSHGGLLHAVALAIGHAEWIGLRAEGHLEQLMSLAEGLIGDYAPPNPEPEK